MIDPVIEAMTLDHNLEIAKLKMQLVLYREALISHNIEPPDEAGEDLLDMWNDCKRVISTANQFVMRLGTSKELLMDFIT